MRSNFFGSHPQGSRPRDEQRPADAPVSHQRPSQSTTGLQASNLVGPALQVGQQQGSSADRLGPHDKHSTQHPLGPKFEQAVREKQAAPHVLKQRRSLKSAANRYMLLPGNSLPERLARRNLFGFSIADTINLMASPLTLYTLPIAAPLIMFKKERSSLYDVSKIDRDAFEMVSVTNSSSRSRDIREALKQAEVLSPDYQLNLFGPAEAFDTIISNHSELSALNLSEREKIGIWSYLKVVRDMMGEKPESLEKMPREMRLFYLSSIGVTTPNNSAFLIDNFQRVGILNEDYLPRDASKMDPKLFERFGGVHMFFKVGNETILRGGDEENPLTVLSSGDEQNPLAAHEVLKRLLFTEALPQYSRFSSQPVFDDPANEALRTPPTEQEPRRASEQERPIDAADLLAPPSDE